MLFFTNNKSSIKIDGNNDMSESNKLLITQKKDQNSKQSYLNNSIGELNLFLNFDPFSSE